MKLVLFVFLPALAWAANTWSHTSAGVPNERIRGGALASPGRIVTWGDSLRIWNSADLSSQKRAAGPFGDGACVLPDGEVIVVRGTGLGELVSIRLGDGQIEVIDTQVEMPDCIAATLFGRSGVLMIQRGMQVRFYHRNAGKWESRDIYSIYTPSYQTGLALADVNGDGRTDIFCGNYWMESPGRWEESWRLFAINTWFEDARSASLRIAVLSPRSIVAAQSHGTRAARFRAPADAKQQWNQTALSLSLVNVATLVRWNRQTLAAERNGAASRLIVIETAEVISSGRETLSVVPLGSDRFAAVSPQDVTVWTQRPRK